MKFNQKPLHKAMAGVLAAMLIAGAPAQADDRESLETLRETTLNLIDALVEQGIFSREKAEQMIKGAQAKAAKAAAKEKTRVATAPVRVQYVPETVKNEIREQLKQEVLAQAKTERWAEPNAVPSWLDRIKWEGDMRVRYQTEAFDKSNAEPFDYFSASGSTSTGKEVTRAAGFLTTNSGVTALTGNTRDDRERFRIRARLGMLAKVSDDWSAGIRLATGNTTDRVSTNQTLGQDFNKYQLLIDRAYIKYEPAEWLSISGGRIANPWFSTDLVWDEDLNFEGFAATIKPSFADGDFKPFLTVGAFPLREENPPTKNNRWVSGVQAGAKWQFARNTRLTFGAALYDYDNLEGRVEDDSKFIAGNPAYGQYEYTSSLRQKGNTLFRTNAASDAASATIWGLASRFRPINLTASLDLAHFDPVRVVLTADYVKNMAFDREDIQRRTGVNLSDGTNYGYLYKIAVGMPKLEKRHDWQATFAYRYLGSDATVDAFTDSDFGLGGTNLKGYQLGMTYGVDQNAWLGLRWMSAESIESFSLDPSHRFAVDLLQADVNVRF
ncbi:MAG: putative porin [Azonexus sp.]|nr:putative porin [Azonexus sp.]